ncbi:MAG: branched-chain amino acid ABC transporter permease [Nitrospirae bacterium]|nr:MAG: branched-chain amino acid ABC transporter permease [Nitrospirota bacterium]
MSITDYIQFTISGLTVGSAYALTALGFTIIFNATGIINFAQGEFVMLGGMLSVFIQKWTGLPLGLSIVVALLITTAVGFLIERLAIRPVRRASVINLIIITIGVSIFVRAIAMLLWGKDTYALPHFSGNKPVNLLGAAVLPQSFWAIGITLAGLFGLYLFFQRTIYGKAMLACAYNPKAASLMGINVQRMVMYSFMLSAFFSALGGALIAPITLTSYDVGIMLGLKGFASCILGGLGNPFGAAAGGFVLGVLESFGAGLVSSAYKDAFAFLLLLLFLFFRPSGLFGKEVKRV